MTWNEIASVLQAFLLLSSVIGAIGGLIELIFRPIRKWNARKKARIEREKRIDKSLVKIDEHLNEAVELQKWQENVTLTLDRHEEAIQDSKNERRVTWRAQRATLDGLKQLGANGLVTGAIAEMDFFADDNMR